jgi:HSP20 family protein
MLARVYQDPVDTFRDFRGELDRMFNTNAAGYTDTAKNWVPAVDIRETKDAYQVTAEVAGVEPKDIDVSLEDNVLTVQGERKSESKDEGEGYSRTERKYGSFYRQFTLPDTVDADSITAKTEHGVLKLHIPKKEKVLPKKISVQG